MRAVAQSDERDAFRIDIFARRQNIDALSHIGDRLQKILVLVFRTIRSIERRVDQE